MGGKQQKVGPIWSMAQKCTCRVTNFENQKHTYTYLGDERSTLISSWYSIAHAAQFMFHEYIATKKKVTPAQLLQLTVQFT